MRKSAVKVIKDYEEKRDFEGKGMLCFQGPFWEATVIKF